MLIVGSNSFIGNYIKGYLIKNNTDFSELNEYNTSKLRDKIIEINPKFVICAINYSENNLEENLKYNIELPLLINEICIELNIHCTQICNGCLYTDNNTNENAIPNLNVSSYSIVSSLKNKILNNCLNLRFRYPVSGDLNPNCYLSKLVSYSKVLNCDNSISVLPSLIPLMFKLINDKQIGVYNFVNNGSINSIDLLIKYKSSVDSDSKILEMSKKEHDTTVGERSNVIVNNSKLNNYFKISHKQNTMDSLLNYAYSNSKELKIESVDIAINNIINDSFKELNLFEQNSKMITDLFPGKGNILDIGCKDGSQLNYLLKLGWETWGIDPSENLCPLCDLAGHETICDYFNEETSKKHFRGFKFDVITAQNVFDGTKYVDSFLRGCKDIMHSGSSLFIQTSQIHILIYSTKSMRTIIERNGLVLYKVREHSIHGRSYIFEIKIINL